MRFIFTRIAKCFVAKCTNLREVIGKTLTLITVIIFIELTSMKENFEAAFKIDVFQKLKALLRRSKELKDDLDELK